MGNHTQTHKIMKLRNALLSGIATAALAAVGAHAQEIDTYPGPGFNSGYNNGDLVLAFFSSSDRANGAQGDLGFESAWTDPATASHAAAAAPHAAA